MGMRYRIWYDIIIDKDVVLEEVYKMFPDINACMRMLRDEVGRTGRFGQVW